MDEARVATIVDITERMLPDVRNIYTIADEHEILELASRLREDLRQLRRVVEDAREKVVASQHREGEPPKPDVPTLPSMSAQAVRTMLGLPEPPTPAASQVPHHQHPQPQTTTQLAGPTAPLYHYPMPPYPPSAMHNLADTSNLLAQHLYPLTLAAAAGMAHQGGQPSPFPLTSALHSPSTTTLPASTAPSSSHESHSSTNSNNSSGKRPEDAVIIIDD